MPVKPLGLQGSRAGPAPAAFQNPTSICVSQQYSSSLLTRFSSFKFSPSFFLPSYTFFFFFSNEMEFVLKLPGYLHAFPFISYYSVILVFLKQWTTTPRIFIKGNWESYKTLKFLLPCKTKNISSPIPKHLYPSKSSFAIKFSNPSYK